MSKEKYSCILVPILSCLCEEIKTYYKLSYSDSMKLLYESELYEMLEEESNKMWYFSKVALFDMLKEEKESGVLNVPE